MVTPSDYGCYHGRGTIAVCAPGFIYLPYYWYSKYPSETPPIWNLLKLFDPQSWMFIFLSILSVSIFFFIASRIGTSYFGTRPFTAEIVLSPFRYKYIETDNVIKNIISESVKIYNKSFILEFL